MSTQYQTARQSSIIHDWNLKIFLEHRGEARKRLVFTRKLACANMGGIVCTPAWFQTARSRPFDDKAKNMRFLRLTVSAQSKFTQQFILEGS